MRIVVRAVSALGVYSLALLWVWRWVRRACPCDRGGSCADR